VVTRVRVGTAGAAVEVHDAPEHLSYSQLAMIHPRYPYACARKWGYRYRIKLPDERSPALAVGSAFDEAANAYYRLRAENVDALTATAKAGDIGLAHLEQERADNAELFTADTYPEYEAVLTAGFAAFLAEEGAREVASVQDRHTFTVTVAPDFVLPIVGYSDRVDVDGTLVDHKFSGSPRWDKEGTWHADWIAEKRDQLLLYWLARNAVEKRTGEPLTPPLTGRGRLVVVYHKVGLVKPQVRSHDLQLSLDDGGHELLVRMVEAAAIIKADRLPARPGPACRYCSYLAQCRDDEAARGMPFFDLIEGPPF
jgi:hypothetical protein